MEFFLNVRDSLGAYGTSNFLRKNLCQIVARAQLWLFYIYDLFISTYSIGEGWIRRQRQRSLHLFVGQNVLNFLRAGCFASVYLEERVQFNRFFQIDRGKTASAARNWTNFAPPNRSYDLCLVLYCNSILLLCPTDATDLSTCATMCASMVDSQKNWRMFHREIGATVNV